MPLRTICVDDEPLALEGFRKKCEADDRFDLLGCFSNASDALVFARGFRVDFAILDIEMPKRTAWSFQDVCAPYTPK